MYLERLMGFRALSTILPPPGTSLAMAPVMTKSGVCLHLMTTDNDDNETRDTLPPIAGESPSELPDASAETWEGYNESKFLHRATAAVINGTNELLKARQIWDIESIVKRQSVLFQEALAPKFEALETRLDGDIGKLRIELGVMKARMAEIEIALGIRAAK